MSITVDNNPLDHDLPDPDNAHALLTATGPMELGEESLCFVAPQKKRTHNAAALTTPTFADDETDAC